jgi:hypothetical protein
MYRIETFFNCSRFLCVQTLHHEDIGQCFSNCGSQRSAGAFGKKNILKIVSGTELMKNTPIHVCAKSAFVGWLPTENRQISSFHNFLSYNYYLRKCFKLVHRRSVTMVTLITGTTFLLFTFMQFLVWGILRRWSACTPTAYEVVRNCRHFE